MPQVAIAAFQHESNSFNPHRTPLEFFTVDRGEEMIKIWRGTHHEIGGFIEGAAQHGFELMPTLSAQAVPSGTVTAAAFKTLLDEMLARLSMLQPFDGLLLALHGAMVSEDYPDADGEIVRQVRALLGPGVPIVVTHDLHANLSESVVRDATAHVIYKTNPHLDQQQCGLHAAGLLARILRDGARPVQALRKPPMLLNIMFHNTSAEPVQRLMQTVRDLEQQPGVLAANFALGYQYADVPEMGPSIVVVTDSDPDLAEREAQRLSDLLWEARHEIQLGLPGAAQAVEQARVESHTPVLLIETGDNVGGGSAGDSTFILSELVRQGAQGWVVVLADSESVQACAQAGIGAELTLSVGGKRDALHGDPVQVTGRVKLLHDGHYAETEPRHGGRPFFDQGLTAVLDLSTVRTFAPSLVVLTSRREVPFSLHQLLSLGIQPQRQKIIVVKAAIAYRAAYEPIAGRIIEVDTPGLTAVNPARFNYHHIRRPLWGVD